MKRLVVFAAENPPREAFILRDAEGLRNCGWDVRFAADFYDGPRPDLILAHFAWTPLFRAKALRLGVPIVCAVHAWDVFAHPAFLVRRRLRGVAGVIACSHAAAEKVGGAEVIHHGLPLEEFSFKPPTSNQVVVSVGRNVRKKGFDILRRAWPKVSAAFPKAELKILRDVSAAEAREAIASSAVTALASRVCLNGDRDGIANVLLEAMALGSLPVTTPAGAFGEIGATHSSIAAGIIEALSLSEEERKKRLCANRALIEREFNLAITSAKLSTFLEKML